MIRRVVKSLLILLPTLNEEGGLSKISTRIPIGNLRQQGWSPSILVVDGDSKDRTKQIAIENGFKLIQQAGKGKGAALRSGFKYALSRKFDALVMLDADATYDPADIIKLIEKLDKFDVVIGDRLNGELKEESMGAVNYFGNHALSWIARTLFSEDIGDLCTGYWAFTKKALSTLELNSMSFEIEAEMFCSSTKNGLKIGSVPISYSKREGEAKLGSLTDGGRILRKLLVRRLFPTPAESKINNDKLALGSENKSH